MPQVESGMAALGKACRKHEKTLRALRINLVPQNVARLLRSSLSIPYAFPFMVDRNPLGNNIHLFSGFHGQDGIEIYAK
ncbi:MAG: hypothetical protein Q7U24_13760, partial [Sulfurimicrobium sp.]|nr:hypothetical protein [Sulfurimicrobium sp.]